MNEGLEEPKTEVAETEASAAEEVKHQPEVLWMRWAYTLEFLIAIMAILSLWGEVGGQGHLDLIPWYTKLAGVLGWCWCCVAFTAGIVEERIFWNRRTIWWFTGILLLTIAMGGITYYYHLHEEPDDGSDDTTATVSTTDARHVCV